jgi:hypothetical protein
MNQQQGQKKCIIKGCDKPIDPKYKYCIKCSKKTDKKVLPSKQCIICRSNIKEPYIKCFKCHSSKQDEPLNDISSGQYGMAPPFQLNDGFIDDNDDINNFFDVNNMCRFCGWCEEFPSSHIEHAGTRCQYINSKYTREQIIEMLM